MRYQHDRHIISTRAVWIILNQLSPAGLAFWPMMIIGSRCIICITSKTYVLARAQYHPGIALQSPGPIQYGYAAQITCLSRISLKYMILELGSPCLGLQWNIPSTKKASMVFFLQHFHPSPSKP